VTSCKQKQQQRCVNNQLDALDEEDFETSKAKMRLMQEQLETLTSLVHKALANKDLNQLQGHFLGNGNQAARRVLSEQMNLQQRSAIARVII